MRDVHEDAPLRCQVVGCGQRERPVVLERFLRACQFFADSERKFEVGEIFLRVRIGEGENQENDRYEIREAPGGIQRSPRADERCNWSVTLTSEGIVFSCYLLRSSEPGIACTC